MGEHDAGRSGGLERPTATEMNEAIHIPESVTPEGLRARADIVRKALGDESCARHLELAADEIVKLSNVPLPATKVLVELLDKFAAADDDGLRRAAMLDSVSWQDHASHRLPGGWPQAAAEQLVCAKVR